MIEHPLRVWRYGRNLTQAELAAKLGISKMSVSYWERWKRHPGARMRRKFEEVFDTKCNGFFPRGASL